VICEAGANYVSRSSICEFHTKLKSTTRSTSSSTRKYFALSLLSYKARVDYTKPIIRNASVPVLYEEALQFEAGTALTAQGALVTDSGEKKGRSPKDKRIVDEPGSSADIWWGPINTKLSENAFMVNRERAIDYLNTRNRLARSLIR
jgi:ATP-dependent phosphoenolpyruvate carboxykinase